MMGTITLYIWLFSILCVFALFGIIALLYLFNLFALEPIRDSISNHKKYKKFYDEHYGEWLKNEFNKREQEAKMNHEKYMEQFKEVSREEYDKFLRSRDTYTNLFMEWYDHYDLHTDQILARNYGEKYYILREDKSE